METTLLHILSWLSLFSFPVALVAPLIGGEVAVLSLAILSGQGTFPLQATILGGFLGMLFLDVMWFLFFRFPMFARMKEWGRHSPAYRDAEKRIEAIARRNDILILLISKMMIGTRILILGYIGMRNITFGRFVFYDGIATSVWAVLLGLFGWASGRGYVAVIHNDTNVSMQLLALSVLVGVFSLLLFFMRRKILRI